MGLCSTKRWASSPISSFFAASKKTFFLIAKNSAPSIFPQPPCHFKRKRLLHHNATSMCIVGVLPPIAFYIYLTYYGFDHTNDLKTNLVSYICYSHCPPHMIRCLTQTASSSADFPCTGRPAEELSSPSSAPLHCCYSRAFEETGLGSGRDAPGFRIVSGRWHKVRCEIDSFNFKGKPMQHWYNNRMFQWRSVIIQHVSTSWASTWCAEAARTWCCCCCLWLGLWVWASVTRCLLRRWGNVFCVVSLRPTLTFSSAGERRSHKICKKIQLINRIQRMSKTAINKNIDTQL